MVVIILTACPEGLRGHLTRWLLEASAGIFVGHVTARVRNLLWARVVQLSKDGRALMIYSQQNEQRLAFKTHAHHWQPTDYDGLLLMLRPAPSQQPQHQAPLGWSKAGLRKRFSPKSTTARSTKRSASEVNETPPEPI